MFSEHWSIFRMNDFDKTLFQKTPLILPLSVSFNIFIETLETSRCAHNWFMHLFLEKSLPTHADLADFVSSRRFKCLSVACSSVLLTTLILCQHHKASKPLQNTYPTNWAPHILDSLKSCFNTECNITYPATMTTSLKQSWKSFFSLPQISATASSAPSPSGASTSINLFFSHQHPALQNLFPEAFSTSSFNGSLYYQPSQNEGPCKKITFPPPRPIKASIFCTMTRSIRKFHCVLHGSPTWLLKSTQAFLRLCFFKKLTTKVARLQSGTLAQRF